MSRTGTPEAEDWSADPWPPLTIGQRSGARLTMRAEAGRTLEDAGLALEPIETRHFLLYSELPRPESIALARRSRVETGRYLAKDLGPRLGVMPESYRPDPFRPVEGPSGPGRLGLVETAFTTPA